MKRSTIQPVIFLGFLIDLEIKNYLQQLDFFDLKIVKFKKNEYAGIYVKNAIIKVEEIENLAASIKNKISNRIKKIETEKLKWVAISQIMIG